MNTVDSIQEKLNFWKGEYSTINRALLEINWDAA